MKIRFWLSPSIIIIGLALFLTSSCKKTDDNKNSIGSITDQDGNVYTSVIIGKQTWMDENLKTTKYNNGDIIGTTTPATLDISNEITPKYQWAYNGDESSVASYGRLYTWYAVTDSRGVCPTGWHVSTDATSAWAHSVSSNFSGIYRYNWSKGYGFSVRCIKD